MRRLRMLQPLKLPHLRNGVAAICRSLTSGEAVEAGGQRACEVHVAAGYRVYEPQSLRMKAKSVDG